ncbi:ribosomal protein P1A [Saccharomycopsis crataegensis]|uniref:Ribosomal protein P1A n=1 Tax=Saccharomycopsis crataegensis TaxID=43959 RepID=A0AAV5QFD1_9ASCO|nr:ribosomal protein P1A [Saccharomycopsis crataegensis]
MSQVESALSYAALILADGEVEITPENLYTLVSKANISVDKIWADIYSKALQGQNIKELLTQMSVGAAPAGAAGAGAAAAGAAEEAAAEESEEEAEESDDDMGFGLFD